MTSLPAESPSTPTPGTLPDAETVIIGGGAVGCGVAYALARAGFRDLLLLERDVDVGRVTTSQGAGLCGQARDTEERIRLAQHSVATFRELQQDPEVTPDWHEVGSLRIAFSERRRLEFEGLKRAADAAGLAAGFISHAEAARRWPLMNFEKATAVLWVPSDGYMTPERVVQAYAHQCRKRGVRIVTGTAVENILLERGRVAGVQTNRGTVKCRRVINAAGAHAYHLARMVQLDLPIIPVRHEYFVTAPMAGLSPDLPCFRIPEWTLYGRVRDGGLLLGGWEPRALHTDPRTYDAAGQPAGITPDWRVLDSFASAIADLLPTAQSTARAALGKGWPTFTPDGRFIIGESCRVPGFVMAGGCNAHGISGSGGIGRLLVESLLEPKPSEYVRRLSPDRFTEGRWTWDQARRDAAHVYETYYGV